MRSILVWALVLALATGVSAHPGHEHGPPEDSERGPPEDRGRSEEQARQGQGSSSQGRPEQARGGQPEERPEQGPPEHPPGQEQRADAGPPESIRAPPEEQGPAPEPSPSHEAGPPAHAQGPTQRDAPALPEAASTVAHERTDRDQALSMGGDPAAAAVPIPLAPEPAPQPPVATVPLPDETGSVQDVADGARTVPLPKKNPGLEAVSKTPMGETLAMVFLAIGLFSAVAIFGTVRMAHGRRAGPYAVTKEEREALAEQVQKAKSAGLDDWQWHRPETFRALQAMDPETVSFWTDSDASDVARWQGRDAPREAPVPTAPAKAPILQAEQVRKPVPSRR